MSSIDREAFIKESLDRILTQYRESPNLLAVIRHDIGQIADAAIAADSIPSFFDIDTSTADQLTLLGKRMGWPRCHCVCVLPPVFGFECETPNPNQTIVGFACEGGGGGWLDYWPESWGENSSDIPSIWADCNAAGSGDYCFTDDEVYRGYLKARRYQMLHRFDLDGLQAAAQHIWGEASYAINLGFGRACVAIGRDLTAREERELDLAFRVLPFAPGIERYVFRGDAPLFGFGTGWAGFCEDAAWFCPALIDPYACA